MRFIFLYIVVSTKKITPRVPKRVPKKQTVYLN
jgi:hypothetical protein